MINWNKEDLANAVHKAGSLNCPNCGAPINEERCPFCGTLFIDFAAIDADEPFFMKIKYNGAVFIVKVALNSVSMTSEITDIHYGLYDRYTFTSNRELTCTFTVLN